MKTALLKGYIISCRRQLVVRGARVIAIWKVWVQIPVLDSTVFYRYFHKRVDSQSCINVSHCLFLTDLVSIPLSPPASSLVLLFEYIT